MKEIEPAEKQYLDHLRVQRERLEVAVGVYTQFLANKYEIADADSIGWDGVIVRGDTSD